MRVDIQYILIVFYVIVGKQNIIYGYLNYAVLVTATRGFQNPNQDTIYTPSQT